MITQMIIGGHGVFLPFFIISAKFGYFLGFHSNSLFWGIFVQNICHTVVSIGIGSIITLFLGLKPYFKLVFSILIFAIA